MHRLAIEYDLLCGLQVGVRQIDSQQRVVLDHGRAEKEGLSPVQRQLAATEEPRPLEVQSFFAQPQRLYVAILIEDGEHVVVLQDACMLVGGMPTWREYRIDR